MGVQESDCWDDAGAAPQRSSDSRLVYRDSREMPLHFPFQGPWWHTLVPVMDHFAKRGLVANLEDIFQRFTFDSTCILVTGHDPRSLSVEFPEVLFTKALDDAEKRYFIGMSGHHGLLSCRVENKIIEELQSKITEEETGKKRLFKAEEVKNLAYLHGALCEALRMKSIWGKIAEFKPERWIDERGGINMSHRSSSFSMQGHGHVLGKEVAFVQMKSVASAIVYNYRICVSDETPVVPAVSIILHTKDGLMAKISTRWD
ncbi:Detected protein of unknown function [Hibiscus syriacus]|uniref:Uncharacterized protein n=1 Tax=Hibiscus syriacus TaxID=106335 RepID=A0A6A2Y254_HIBSY|nr:Detected protein of unknown function [Hibiscus syriacus]